MLPVFSREVEEGNQALPRGNQRLYRFGVLGLILGREAKPGGLALGAGVAEPETSHANQ